jgi:outer membrane biosynthesis protein TonB
LNIEHWILDIPVFTAACPMPRRLTQWRLTPLFRRALLTALPLALILAAIAPALIARAVAKEELLPSGAKQRERDAPPNPLRDVSGDMSRVAKRLTQGETGDQTQDIEKAILEKLNGLVDQAEKQQQQQQSKSDPSQAPKPQPKESQPKPDSKKQEDEAKQKEAKQQPKPAQKQQESERPGIGPAGQGKATGQLTTDAAEWGNLPPAVRDQLLQTRGEGFPLKYRELLRRYYRELSKPRE